MKTTEEKAKAYDEVVNKLRHFIAKGVDPLITRADVQDFFPELAESEGEKIKKRITLCLEECVHSDVIRDYEKDECIAWLEKQGEQKPADKVEPKFKVGDKIYLKPEYRMPDDDTPIANTVKEIRGIDDKHYRFDGSYIFIEDQDKYALVEQKPAWSEEDSFRTETLISVIKSGGSIRPELRNEYVNWLKSLRPLKRWKPSDEQIDLLQAIINEPNNASSESCQIALKDILEQLKKLKEG